MRCCSRWPSKTRLSISDGGSEREGGCFHRGRSLRRSWSAAPSSSLPHIPLPSRQEPALSLQQLHNLWLLEGLERADRHGCSSRLGEGCWGCAGVIRAVFAKRQQRHYKTSPSSGEEKATDSGLHPHPSPHTQHTYIQTPPGSCSVGRRAWSRTNDAPLHAGADC